MKHSSENDLRFRVDVLDECVIEVQRKRLAKCDELEYIEKCMQVHTNQEEDFLEHQTFFFQNTKH